MTLLLDPSNPVMEARPLGTLPQGEQWRYEVRFEVRFDHATDSRFRHGTTLLRWRPDRAPRLCGSTDCPGRPAPRSTSSHARVSLSVLPLGDGLTIARKR
jgi:hypothetical protein